MINSEQDIKNFASQKALIVLQQLSITEPEVLDFKVDGSVWKNGKLVAERLTEDQEEWVERRMRSPAKSWERWFVGQYFTEEQKNEMGLTDKEIAGKGRVE